MLLKKSIAVSAAVLATAISNAANASRPIVVAVIDTGVSQSVKDSNVMCKYGHRDFTGTDMTDVVGHGSHISGLIDQYAKNILVESESDFYKLKAKKANYCQVVIKFYDPRSKNKSTVDSMSKSIRWAIDINVDIINISAGGQYPSQEEEKLIKMALDKGIKVVSAAGNEGCELGSLTVKGSGFATKLVKCNYYPAMYDHRIYVVGSKNEMDRAPTSNYGYFVNSWENGASRASYGIGTTISINSGTSQATAVKTGKIVESMLKNSASR